MTREESKNLMKRIKEHYQDFIVDEGKIDEWHSYLKDYSYSDVSKKLDEHLSSEQYGQYIPKVAFLVKYLTKEDDKNKIEDYKIQCYICGKYMKNSEFDKHFGRCSSINYMNKQRNKYFGKNFDNVMIKKLWDMEEKEFREKYKEMLKVVRDNTEDEEEKDRVKKILEGEKFIIQSSFVKMV